MKANTRLFGEIDIEDDKIITMDGGMIGFPFLQKFTLIFDEEKEKKGRMRRSQSRANRSFSLRDRRLIKRSRRSASACPAHCSV